MVLNGGDTCARERAMADLPQVCGALSPPPPAPCPAPTHLPRSLSEDPALAPPCSPRAGQAFRFAFQISAVISI